MAARASPFQLAVHTDLKWFIHKTYSTYSKPRSILGLCQCHYFNFIYSEPFITVKKMLVNIYKNVEMAWLALIAGGKATEVCLSCLYRGPRAGSYLWPPTLV